MDERTSAPPLPPAPSAVTPMMEQFLRLKEKVGEALLFFRMGDFYELFQGDALIASKALNIALTSRHKQHNEPIPMCGVPVHSVETYIDRLLQQGFKVAIGEQLEDPRHADGLVKRDIVRVITPGTVMSSSALEPKANNFLASLAVSSNGAGFAYLDVSTGDFAVTTWEHGDWPQELQREYGRVQPRELLLPDPLPLALPADWVQPPTDLFTTTVQPWSVAYFHPAQAYQRLTKQFAVQTLDGFGCEHHPLAIAAAGALLAYVHETQQNAMSHLQSLRVYHTGHFMVLDEATRRHLALLPTSRAADDTGSLLEVLDATLTPMGGRLLRQWLAQPLCLLPSLLERQAAVAILVDDSPRRRRLRQALDTIVDLERILGRIALGTVAPRELAALRQAIAALPAVAAALQAGGSPLLDSLWSQWDPLTDIATLLSEALAEPPPASLRDGQVIRAGYHAELDALRAHATAGTEWLNEFEAQERQRTGIASLRIGFHKVFGYYLEVRNASLAQVPAEYLRKQTLAHAERFVTPALKDREVHMLRAAEEAAQLEARLYDAVRQRLAQSAPRVQQMAQILSQLDVLAALAESAVTHHYSCPTLDMSDTLHILEGRHPVLEAAATGERFVPNDVMVTRDTQQILLLTGPNMAGKSTYMRQIALIVVLAQIGSFVPARSAHIGLVDRIFTRIGAQDRLRKGHSTFMVEMTETANILHNVTARSLVLLDEIGRGTSTYDGLSIAWAVIEYLHNHGALRPRTLFATHYHELTALATTLTRVHNYHTAVQEEGEQIRFLRQIRPGSSDRSYGIHVARLAGLPAAVLQRAHHILTELETSARPTVAPRGKQRALPRVASHTAGQGQLSLFDTLVAQLLDDLRTLSVDTLDPAEAVHRLLEFQRKARRLP